jgi:hypothetical protein
MYGRVVRGGRGGVKAGWRRPDRRTGAPGIIAGGGAGAGVPPRTRGTGGSREGRGSARLGRLARSWGRGRLCGCNPLAGILAHPFLEGGSLPSLGLLRPDDQPTLAHPTIGGAQLQVAIPLLASRPHLLGRYLFDQRLRQADPFRYPGQPAHPCQPLQIVRAVEGTICHQVGHLAFLQLGNIRFDHLGKVWVSEALPSRA